ncbi:hypothetical protein LOK49_LG13G00131 [Camellia lanceoleosa]|uniref:Uncharacterized protein n=1 Tax=Camellia lanceoleosa TaxID=1840588 RepID=A0ACC0FKM5_9ERIC|nr:hypothetical protein LOK49_LG13G00131 [Camellia lanceoleosa]
MRPSPGGYNTVATCAQDMDPPGRWYQLCLWSLDQSDLLANGCTTYDLMQNLIMNMNMNMSMYLNLFLIWNLKMHKTLFLIRLCF